MNRDELRVVLADNGIETRTFFIPMHCQPIYWEQFKGERYPVAEQFCRDGLLSAVGVVTDVGRDRVCSRGDSRGLSEFEMTAKLNQGAWISPQRRGGRHGGGHRDHRGKAEKNALHLWLILWSCSGATAIHSGIQVLPWSSMAGLPIRSGSAQRYHRRFEQRPESSLQRPHHQSTRHRQSTRRREICFLPIVGMPGSAFRQRFVQKLIRLEWPWV